MLFTDMVLFQFLPEESGKTGKNVHGQMYLCISKEVNIKVDLGFLHRYTSSVDFSKFWNFGGFHWLVFNTCSFYYHAVHFQVILVSILTTLPDCKFSSILL